MCARSKPTRIRSFDSFAARSGIPFRTAPLPDRAGDTGRDRRIGLARAMLGASSKGRELTKCSTARKTVASRASAVEAQGAQAAASSIRRRKGDQRDSDPPRQRNQPRCSGGDAARGSREAHLPIGPRRLHRPAAVRPRNEIHLRGQLGLPRARKPDSQCQRLPDHLHRSPAGGHHAQPGRQASRPGQHLHAPRCRPVPPQERQPLQLHLPVPRLDHQQQRQAVKSQGPIAGCRLPPKLQLRRQPRHEEAWRLRRLSGLPVRQRQPRRASAERALGRGGQDHRHDRRPSPRGHRGAARHVDLYLRRQLEAAGRERRRRLPCFGSALELCGDHKPAQC